MVKGGQQIKTISYRLSSGDWTIREEPVFQRVDPYIGDFFSVQGDSPVTYTVCLITAFTCVGFSQWLIW